MKSIAITDTATVALLVAQLSDSERNLVWYDGVELSGADALIDRLSATDLATLQRADLIAYANARQWKVATGGRSITINGTTVAFATDPTSLSLITGKAARLGQPNPPATVNWQTSPTTSVSIAAADFLAAASSLADFVQSTFDVLLQTVIPGINAGNITTTAQIDSAIVIP